MGRYLLSETRGLVEAPCRGQINVLMPFRALRRVMRTPMEDMNE
jgi:hypothetical protein